MATYLTLNSKFTPYTYEEILKPYQDRQEAYDAKMESINEIEGKTSLWEGILDPSTDKEQYEAFENYKSRLAEISSRLGNGNASAVTKAEINKLAQEYSRTFAPMELRYAEIKQAQEDQRKTALQAAAQGKNIRFTKDMFEVPLSRALADPTWNQYGVINLDSIAEQVAAAGASYGKNAAFYNVFGTTMGNTEPENPDSVLEKLYQQYIPEGISASLSDEIKREINSSFNLGAQQSHAEEIAHISDASALREIQGTQANTASTNARTAYIQTLLELHEKGLEIKDGVIVKTGTEEGGAQDVEHINPNDLLYDNIYTGLYYIVDSKGNRIYYKKQGQDYTEVPTEGSKVAFKQNGKIKYHDYKDNKIYVKNQDGQFVEDVIKQRSETYDDAGREKARDLFDVKYGNVYYVDVDAVREKNFKTRSFAEAEEALKEISGIYDKNEDQIEIIPAEAFMRNGASTYNLWNTEYKHIEEQIMNTGYDPEQLVLIRDKENDERFLILLKTEPGLPVSILSNYPKLYKDANGMEPIETSITNEGIDPNSTVEV